VTLTSRGRTDKRRACQWENRPQATKKNGFSNDFNLQLAICNLQFAFLNTSASLRLRGFIAAIL
jgi:hypothetical protein